MNDADKEVEPRVQNEDTKCPWCPYTGNLKQAIRHMESGHYQKWCDLALYPPIAGERY
jgi:hypothetical protein